MVTGGSMKQIFQASILGSFISSGNKKLQSMVVKPNKDLGFVKELIEKGHIKPVIDRIYSFSEVNEAFKHYDGGHASGKIIISL